MYETEFRVMTKADILHQQAHKKHFSSAYERALARLTEALEALRSLEEFDKELEESGLPKELTASLMLGFELNLAMVPDAYHLTRIALTHLQDNQHSLFPDRDKGELTAGGAQ